MFNILDQKEAMVEVFGVEDTIENHIKRSLHYFGEEISYITVGSKMLPKEYLTDYEKMLWCKFLRTHTEIDLDFLPEKFIECLDFLKSQEGKEFSTLLKSEDLLILNKDIFTCKEDIICHQVNCQGVMGRGIAKTIKEKYPECYEEYRGFCMDVEDKKDLLGNALLVDCGDKMIANLFAQETYGSNGCYTDYNAFRTALQTVKNEAVEMNFSVAIPYGIGSSLAGGDWNIISGIIKEVFCDYPVIIYRI